ncbi:ATP-grasp domain-containing protein [Planococcus salinus]|uniref:ATP-grasp domain-containing protein n=1 Tax=Planococcus salinus TaxID=1848460 RepID=A0A3M8PBZ2_9BACL|nr:ATP-grasp domain-containing protein [Planococcus salinus]RNF41153.1 ATP-grasp domain-containing protein [Planococcus salinus]
MKNIRVLVTGIGGPTAQGILRGFLEKDNVYVVGVDRREVTSGNQFCDKTYTIPRFSNLDAYKSAIQTIIEEEEIDAVFPALHEEIEIFNDFRKELDAAVALPNSEHFDVLVDKEKAYGFLEEQGFSTYIPRYIGFSDTDELKPIIDQHFADEQFVVVKQISGYGALGFAVLTDRPTYLQALKEGKNKIVNIDDYVDIPSTDRRIAMEYLGGTEYSVDVFVHNGKVVVAVPRERTGVSSGIVLDGKVIYNEQLIKAATDITESMVTDGFLNLQFFSSEDGYKLTDINARFCGSQVMGLGAGVNFPYLFLQYQVLGEYEKVTPRWNTRMIRFRDHFFVYED